MFFLASSYPKAPAPGRVLGVCWERASCRECACSCFLMPRGSCSHKSDTPCWTTCMEDCLYKEDRLWCAKIISTDWRPPHHEKQKVFSPMMKKNNYGRITFFFFLHSDCPVGVKIPPPRYRIQAFKMHKDRWALLLSCDLQLPKHLWFGNYRMVLLPMATLLPLSYSHLNTGGWVEFSAFAGCYSVCSLQLST